MGTHTLEMAKSVAVAGSWWLAICIVVAAASRLQLSEDNQLQALPTKAAPALTPASGDSTIALLGEQEAVSFAYTETKGMMCYCKCDANENCKHYTTRILVTGNYKGPLCTVEPACNNNFCGKAGPNCAKVAEWAAIVTAHHKTMPPTSAPTTSAPTTSAPTTSAPTPPTSTPTFYPTSAPTFYPTDAPT